MRYRPSISILMPAFNSATSLRRAVESISIQTEEDWELIAIDDGSSDETPELLEQLAATDSRVRVIRKAHSGVVDALEVGWSEARGQLIARMDADDVSRPDRLRLQRKFLELHQDVGVVSCQVTYAGDAIRNAGYARYVDWINRLITAPQIALNRFVESPLAHPSVLFRRQCVERFGGYRKGLFPEDYELWLRWLEAGVLIEKVPAPLLEWSDPPARVSRTDPRYSADNFFRVKTPYLARWLAKNNPHHPNVIVWGAGRLTRRRIDLLRAEGIQIRAYVDIDPAKIGRRYNGAPVLNCDELPQPGESFVLSYVGKVDARDQIEEWLQARGFVQGSHYLLVA